MSKPTVGRPRRRKPPQPVVLDDVIGLPLTKGLTAWIDVDDYPLVKDYVWCAAKHLHTWYAKTKINNRTVYLHSLIMRPPMGMEVDHVNGSGLVCCRWNMRNVTHQMNMRNSRRCVGGKCLQKMMEHETMEYADKLAAALQESEAVSTCAE